MLLWHTGLRGRHDTCWSRPPHLLQLDDPRMPLLVRRRASAARVRADSATTPLALSARRRPLLGGGQLRREPRVRGLQRREHRAGVLQLLAHELRTGTGPRCHQLVGARGGIPPRPVTAHTPRGTHAGDSRLDKRANLSAPVQALPQRCHSTPAAGRQRPCLSARMELGGARRRETQLPLQPQGFACCLCQLPPQAGLITLPAAPTLDPAATAAPVASTA